MVFDACFASRSKGSQLRGAREIDPLAEFILSGVEGLRTGRAEAYSGQVQKAEAKVELNLNLNLNLL